MVLNAAKSQPAARRERQEAFSVEELIAAAGDIVN
jgi:hypothetical protein